MKEKLISKKVTIPCLLSAVVSLAALTMLLLFQFGILWNWGLTMLTSDIVVYIITGALAVGGVFALISFIAAMILNSKAKKANAADSTESVKEAIVDNAPHGETKVKAEDEQPTKTVLIHQNKKEDFTPAAEPEQNEPATVSDKPEPVDMNNAHSSPAVEDASDNMNAEANIDTAEEQNVPDAEDATESFETTPISAENTEDQTEPIQEEPIELTEFEKRIAALMQKGNVPETAYAIEEYREGAVCIARDATHYFVYICKNESAEDVEIYPLDSEREVAQAFVNKLNHNMAAST